MIQNKISFSFSLVETTTTPEQMERLIGYPGLRIRSIYTTEIVATKRAYAPDFRLPSRGNPVVGLSFTYHMREYDYRTSISFSEFIRAHCVGREARERVRNICNAIYIGTYVRAHAHPPYTYYNNNNVLLGERVKSKRTINRIRNLSIIALAAIVLIIHPMTSRCRPNV